MPTIDDINEAVASRKLTQERKHDIQMLIQGHQQAIRQMRSDIDNPERVVRELEHLVKLRDQTNAQIAKLQPRLDKEKTLREMSEHRRQIAQLRADLHAEDLNELKELAAKYQELQSQMQAAGIPADALQEANA